MLQQILNGLSLGGTYALLALGLAIVFNILGLVNFAYGELITIPGYAMYGLYTLGLPWILFAPLGIASGVLAALAMDVVAFRPVRRAAPTTMLLTSFGLAIIIQALFQMFVSPRSRAVPQPAWILSSITVGGVRIPTNQILTIVVTAVSLALLLVVLKRTLIGTAMRSASEDFDATRLMGIRANRVIAAAFAISGLLAGIACVLILTRRGSVDPTMGFEPLLKAFVANVVGGMGSLFGAVAGGLLLGFVEVALRAWLPEGMAGLADAFVFAFVAVLLLVRPGGLLGVRAMARA